MTSITRNLPPFVRELGVSIVGKECYTSLVENLNVQDVKCLKFALSKGLGLGIVVGGTVMKVPQILLIVNAGSSQGLSLPAYILETLSYAITLAYSFRNEFPFSTYGENFFLTIQNIIITLLIIAYSPSQNKSAKLAFAAVSTIATAGAIASLPKDTLSLLQMSTLPLSLFSKLPQIQQNARAGSTGQLSAVAVFAQIAGCLARLFTTATEVGDTLVAAGFGLALLLNLVLGTQVWMYWGQSERIEEHVKTELKNGHVAEVKQEEKKASTTAIPAYSEVVERRPAQQTVNRVATPPPSGGKKWTRKVD